MKEVGVYEAKTHFTKLVAEVERGETVTVTRHGKPVAKIVPVEEKRPDMEEIIEDFRQIRQRTKPDRMTIKEMIEEGRRY